MPSMGGGGKTPLWEKIRSLPDANGTSAISIDISDIDWTKWQEIRILGELYNGGAAIVVALFRFNNLSATNYSYTFFESGPSSFCNGTSQSSLFGSQISIGANNQPAYINFRVGFHYFTNMSGSRAYLMDDSVCSTGGSALTGAARYEGNISALTSFNISISSGTLYLQNASLWGIKK